MLVWSHEGVLSDVQEDAMTVGPPCSGFMREMQSFTSRIHAQHLSKYQCKEEISTQYVVHYTKNYLFSRAPRDMKSPHQVQHNEEN